MIKTCLAALLFIPALASAQIVNFSQDEAISAAVQEMGKGAPLILVRENQNGELTREAQVVGNTDTQSPWIVRAELSIIDTTNLKDVTNEMPYVNVIVGRQFAEGRVEVGGMVGTDIAAPLLAFAGTEIGTGATIRLSPFKQGQTRLYVRGTAYRVFAFYGEDDTRYLGSNYQNVGLGLEGKTLYFEVDRGPFNKYWGDNDNEHRHIWIMTFGWLLQ